MATQSNAARRTWVVEEYVDPDTELPVGFYDREEAHALLADIESVLFTVGGMVSIAAEREQIDELDGEPLAVTRRLIVQWQAYSPLQKREPEVQPPQSAVQEAPPEYVLGDPAEDEQP